MSVEHWSKEVVLVNLPREPETAEELAYVTELICEGHNCDVIVDCSEVDTITSCSRSRLATLYRELFYCGRRLVLCNPSSVAMSVFDASGLAGVLDFVGDKSAALANIMLSHN
ncbi:MAG: STAS domain-containing protein [Phycisphaerales bacterium]|nr:MAG: STAS domain-containing protein [Phycisphaerales bacterium]UCF15657.1 MAG: STAS domain-containing protein [Phycisphaerales bacterium]